MIDVPRRLRRAILLNDVGLVKRITQNNPSYLRNPDFEDKSNTSLHLAAKHGFTQIAVRDSGASDMTLLTVEVIQEYLIDAGHEDDVVSINSDWETPLMLAAVAGKEETGVMLAKRFPNSIALRNQNGLDAVRLFVQTHALDTLTLQKLMLACRSGIGTLHLIPTLLLLAPSILNNVDHQHNNALHHASAAGELKALRMLLQYGANPLAQNAYSWTPVHYSASPAAETYFKSLIIEFEKKKAEGKRVERERERQRTAGVRLVTDVDGGSTQNAGANASVVTAEGAERQRARDDAAIAGLPAPGMIEWSPIERRRAMTPTERNTGWLPFSSTDVA